MTPRPLAAATAVETLSLAALLTNLATAHVPWIASVLGPVHGFCHLVVIALAGPVGAAGVLAHVPGRPGWLCTTGLVREDARGHT